MFSWLENILQEGFPQNRCTGWFDRPCPLLSFSFSYRNVFRVTHLSEGVCVCVCLRSVSLLAINISLVVGLSFGLSERETSVSWRTV